MEVPYPASRLGTPNIDFLSPSVGISALQGKMTVYGDESLAEAIAGPRLLRWKSIGNGSEKSILSQEPKTSQLYSSSNSGHRKYNSGDLENDFTQTKRDRAFRERFV